MNSHQEIYLLRHGETDFNLQGIIQGSGVDADLNATGRAQAAQFYATYGHLPFEAVLTSALKRTEQTVAPFIAAGIPHFVYPELNEMSWGEQEGLKSTAASIAEYETIKEGWGRGEIDGRIAGGESAREMGLRLQNFLAQLALRPERLLLVCSHGRAMCGLVTLMEGQPIEYMNQHRHSNTGLWVAQRPAARPHFQFRLRNDRSHLPQAERILH
ncbi:MAG: histidine phosphatase family protein [Lewinella sp.]|nr:histidine phosphatase family protein [Lewinella sp.]